MGRVNSGIGHPPGHLGTLALLRRARAAKTGTLLRYEKNETNSISPNQLVIKGLQLYLDRLLSGLPPEEGPIKGEPVRPRFTNEQLGGPNELGRADQLAAPAFAKT